jgi:hypothetical protein
MFFAFLLYKITQARRINHLTTRNMSVTDWQNSSSNFNLFQQELRGYESSFNQSFIWY